MMVAVERGSEEPVYGQIARQIRAHIASRRLVPGATLPPVRRLASDLGVNLNTVARAYRLLEEEGFLRIVGRSGAEVAAPLPSTPAPDRRRLEDELRHLLARMRQAGLSARELRAMALRTVDDLGGEGRES